ncbi:hypothetical protein [Spiroplasma diminutum]|uniref:Transmembrane protein n=1 Tax=Spiroplasma diminutum CUAS-1 TaxID=1276221 RepID=S5LZ65_9MOLU|nr:hypothetical protein [Spiroplasma diminutum]AGR41861.1 hypothetical protein SDIMI_v3c01570 [Spiroplasma diminutum CUAS-1]
MKRKLKIISWYIFFIYFFAFLVLSAVMAQLDPAPRYHVFNWYNRIFADMSFWTTQTNWMFFIFFLFVALDGKWGLWKPGKIAWINFLSYFTLTMGLFWSALTGTLSNQDINSNPLVSYANVYNTFIKWFITVTTHLVTYIIAMTYFFVFIKKEKIDIASFYKKELLIGWIYPIFYLLFVIIRMTIMNKLGSDYFLNQISAKEQLWLEDKYEWVIKLLEDDNSKIGIFSTPYFFFNPNVKNGIELLTTGTIFCLFLIVLCQYFMIWLNNLCIKEKSKKERNVFSTTKEEKVLGIITILLSAIFISLAIYKLTDIDKYNFSDKNSVLYDFMYLFLYIIILLFNISSIVFTILKITNVYNNPTLNFITTVMSSLFALNFYFASVIILLPLIYEKIYLNKKIPSNI